MTDRAKKNAKRIILYIHAQGDRVDDDGMIGISNAELCDALALSEEEVEAAHKWVEENTTLRPEVVEGLELELPDIEEGAN